MLSILSSFMGGRLGVRRLEINAKLSSRGVGEVEATAILA